MPQHVCNGAQLMCSFGVAPSALTVLPKNRMKTSNQPAANVMDNVPMTNIMPFGMCNSLANPQVASATSAALGVLTPMPCQPVIPGPWKPGAATVILSGQPALDSVSTLNCAWAGVITIVNPGQTTENIP